MRNIAAEVRPGAPVKAAGTKSSRPWQAVLDLTLEKLILKDANLETLKDRACRYPNTGDTMIEVGISKHTACHMPRQQGLILEKLRRTSDNEPSLTEVVIEIAM